MKENISSPELTLNIWSNDACRGYVIMAMQDCGFTHKDISRVVNQLYGVFDLYTLNEAEQKYYNGEYYLRANVARGWGKLKGQFLPGSRFFRFPQQTRGKLAAVHPY